MTIGGSFTITTISDGAQGNPTPTYTLQQYAWSASLNTASPSIPPTDITTWNNAIPQSDTGKPYLWLKTEKWDWDGTYTNDVPNYTLVSTSYARLSGENGTGFQPKGKVATSSALPQSGNVVGDAYMVEDTGHLWVWNGTSWVDFGEVKGDPGLNSYIHLAWAHAVGDNGYPTSGMGFTTSKEANENFEYMGVLVDNTEIDSQTPSDYIWNRINGSVFVDLDNDNDVLLYSQGTCLASVTSQATLYVGANPIASGVSWTCETSRTGNVSNVSASINSTSGLLTVSGMTADTGWVLVKATYQGVVYTEKMSLRKSEDDKYEIVPSVRAVAYNISTNQPPSVTVTFKIKKTTTSGTSTFITSVPSNMTLTAKGDGTTTMTLSHASNSDTWSFTTNNAVHSSYTIELKNGSITEDIETIPIIKSANGDKGNDAVNLILTPSSIMVTCTSYGDIIGDQDYSVTAQVNVGGVAATVTNISVINSLNGIETQVDGDVLHIQPIQDEADSSAIGELEVRVTYMFDGIAGYVINGTIAIGVVYNGADGRNGNDGKNSVRIDLDNEADAMQYSSSGTKITQSVITRARLYDGHTLITASSGTNGVTWGHTASGLTAAAGTFSSGVKPYTISALSSESATLTITATYKSVTYSAVFSVKKLIDQDKYQIQILPNAVVFNPDTMATPAEDIKVGIIKYPADGSSPQSLTTLAEVSLWYQTIALNGTASSETQISSLTNGYYTIAKANINTEINAYRFNIKNSSNKVLDSETIPIAKVVNGKDNIYADLSNEMDAIPMDSEGKVIGSNVVTTGVAMYFGSTAQTLTNITWATPPSGVSVAKTPSTGTPTGIRVTIANGTTLANDKVTIALTAYATINGQGVNKTLDFTIQGVRGGADGTSPTIYQLNPSDTTIRKAKDGTISPSTVSCTKLKRVGNSAPVDTEDSAVRIFYQIDSEATEHAYVNPISTSSVTSGIRFTLYQGAGVTNGLRDGGTLIDVETVPIVEDGQDGESIAGENSVRIDLDNEMDAIQYSDGTKIGNSVVTHARLYDGSDNISNSSNVSWTVSSRSGCSNSQAVLTTPTPTNNYATLTVSGFSAGSIRAAVTIKATYKGVEYFATFTVNKLVNKPKYELHITPNVLSYNSTDQTSNYDTLVIKIYKTDIDGTHEYVDNITNNFDIVVRGWDGSRYNPIQRGEDAGDEVSYVVDYDENYLEYDVVLQSTLEEYLDHETIPVISVRNGASLQVQYAPNANPTSSQIHTTFQNGDEYMRTKLSTSGNWSGWQRIVGENGGETDYQFGISAQSTTTNASTAPTLKPNTSWSDAPIPTESDYPYLWAKVQRKNGDGTNDGNAYYIRLSGEAAVVYSLESNVGEFTIPTDETSVNVAFTVSAYKKVGSAEKQSESVYFGWYRRKGTTYTQIGRSPRSLTSQTIQNISVNTTSTDAIVVFCADALAKLPTSSTMPTQALASIEIPVHKQGDTGPQGSNAVSYRFKFNEASANIDASGKLTTAIRWEIYKNDGNSDNHINIQGKCSYRPSNVQTWTTAPMNYSSIYECLVALNTTISRSNMPTSIMMRYQENNITLADATIPITIVGQMGRNFYYAGEYSSTTQYELTDFSAPFVSYETNGVTNYWVLTGNNGISTRVAPSSASGNPWEIMQSDFKYLITEAFFTNFAKLGSSVFNEDYMFSQLGTIKGVLGANATVSDSGQFQYADPSDMDGENFDDTWMDVGARGKSGFSSTTYTSLFSINFDDDGLVKRRWYTILFEVDGAGTSGTMMSLQVVDNQGTPRNLYGIDGIARSTQTIDVSGSGVLQFGFVFQEAGASNVDSYTFKVKMNQSNTPVDISTPSIAPAKFSPSLYINLRTGQMTANNLTARGMLYASSVGYSKIIGSGNNETLYVKDNTFVALKTTFRNANGVAKVILPDPSTCQGRVVELFRDYESSSNQGLWQLNWENSTDDFYDAFDKQSLVRNYDIFGVFYIKFFATKHGNNYVWSILKLD